MIVSLLMVGIASALVSSVATRYAIKPRIVEVEKIVEVEIEKVVEVEKLIEVENIVEVEKIVQAELRPQLEPISRFSNRGGPQQKTLITPPNSLEVQKQTAEVIEQRRKASGLIAPDPTAQTNPTAWRTRLQR